MSETIKDFQTEVSKAFDAAFKSAKGGDEKWNGVLESYFGCWVVIPILNLILTFCYSKKILYLSTINLVQIVLSIWQIKINICQIQF